jgi:uncharacterized membrane protein YdbT with pleckstrin-like domain
MSDSPNATYDRHPVMFRNRPGSFVLLYILLFAPPVILIMYRSEITGHGQLGAIALLAISALAFFILITWFANTRATRLRIGGDEIHLEEGLLRKRHVDLNVAQVRTVRVMQGFFERIFRVGQIEIFTTGDHPEFIVKGMPSPHWVRDFVRNRRSIDQ